MNELITVVNNGIVSLFEATNPNAAQMTTGLKNFGNGNMLDGIHNLCEISREIGVEQGIEIGIEKTIDTVKETLLPIAYKNGFYQGKIQGTVGTIIFIGTTTLVTFAAVKLVPVMKRKIHETKNRKKIDLNSLNNSETHNNVNSEEENDVQNCYDL